MAADEFLIGKEKSQMSLDHSTPPKASAHQPDQLREATEQCWTPRGHVTTVNMDDGQVIIGEKSNQFFAAVNILFSFDETMRIAIEGTRPDVEKKLTGEN